MKYIEIFTKRFCPIESIDSFMQSEVCRYLSLVYGELTVSYQPTVNFYYIYKSNSDLFIGEAVFYDHAPDKKILACVLPKRISDVKLGKWPRPYSPQGKHLSNFGYVERASSMPTEVINDLVSAEYSLLNEQNKINTLEVHDDIAKLRHSDAEWHDETYELYVGKNDDNHYQTQDGFMPKSLNIISKSNREYNEGFGDSPLLLKHMNNVSLYTQRMKLDHVIPRHSDALTNGLDRTIMTHLSWFCPASFSGRELVCGIRSQDELIEFIKIMNSRGTHMGKYNTVPKTFNDIYRASPSNDLSVIINAVNPVFYHGVEPHLGGGDVYTIIDQMGVT